MKLNNERPYKFGSDYFSVSNLSSLKRDQLLRPVKSNNVTSISNNPPYIIQNIKKETEYIEALKNDIVFSADVAAERCIHLLPYNDRYYDSLYYTNKKSKKGQKLTNLTYNVPSKHMCDHKCKDLKIRELPPVKQSRVFHDGSTDVGSIPQSESVEPRRRGKRYWDEYMLSLVSPETAQFIAFDASHEESQAKRLQDLVQTWYGAAPPFRELIPDGTDDTTQESKKENLRSSFPYKYYMDLVQSQRTNKPTENTELFNMDPTPKQKIADLLSREVSFYNEEQQTDPYGDDTKAAFYRLPALVRRQKKNTEILDKDSGNKTLENLLEYRLPITPPRRLDTVLNPKLGDKILSSDNQFQQDLLISTEMNQTKLLNEPNDLIMIDNTVYKKSLQPIWPIMVTSKMPSEDNLELFRPTKNGLFKGHNRWTSLPEREESNLQSINDDNNTERQSRLESRKRMRDHSSVNLIVDQWRKKWQLTQKYNDSTVEALLRDMTDAHPTIRMQAIVTIAKSGSRSLLNADDGNDGPLKETMRSDVIPDVLLQSIQILLDDTHQQVRKAAAVALHSLEMCSDKSLKILRDMLGSGSSVDRWTAAQCLALSDIYDSHVISELVDQLMNSEDIIIHEKASILLAKMSFHTKLVHGMLGEKLNTVSWRQRIIICKTLPLLHGSLNKDIMRKLIYLMWNDQHREVRIASSHAIGKTGNGKAVHDELIKKLQDVSEVVRTDALEKIGILRVMTTRMMPAFLKCFNDDFVMVRKAVCRTCYRLAIQDELCVKNMLAIARYDPSHRVKIYAVRALSKVKVANPNIRTCFTWALQYESEVRLRCEALHSLLMSTEMDKEMVDILKSRFLVEDDRDIVKLLKKALISIGINPDEDIDTVAEVKSEVRRFLSDKNHITDIILDNEAVEDYDLQRSLMIASSLEVSPESSERGASPKEMRVQFADFEAYQEDMEDELNVENCTTNIREKSFYDLIETRSVLERVDEDEEFSQEDVLDNEVEEINEERNEEDGLKEEKVNEEGNEDEGLKKEGEEEVNEVGDEEEDVKEAEEAIEEIIVEEGLKEDEEEVKEEGQEEEEVKEAEEVMEVKEEFKKGEEVKYEDEEEERVVTRNQVDDEELNENEMGSDYKKESVGKEKEAKEKWQKEKQNIEESTVLDQTEEDIQLDGYVDLKPVTERNTDDVNYKNEDVKRENVDDAKELERANEVERATDVGETDEPIRCTYNLPSDTSYLKVFSSERSLTWMTWETPVMYDDPSQLNMLESTISSSVMEQVNSAIEYEGIDCGPSEQM